MGQVVALPQLKGLTQSLEDLLKLIINELRKCKSNSGLLTSFFTQWESIHNEIRILFEELKSTSPIGLLQTETSTLINTFESVVNTFVSDINEFININTTNIQEIQSRLSYLESSFDILDSLGPLLDLNSYKQRLDVIIAALQVSLQEILNKVSKTTTINGFALQSNIYLTKESIGFDQVENEEQLIRAADQWGLFPVVPSVNTNSSLLLESVNNDTEKRNINISNLPVPSAYMSTIANYVKKTTTVNNIPLSSDIILTSGSFGLELVENTSNDEKVVSTALLTELEKKADKITIIPGDIGGASTASIITVNANGLITSSSEEPIVITGTSSGFDKVKNVDTTKATNVIITDPFSATEEARHYPINAHDLLEISIYDINRRCDKITPFTINNLVCLNGTGGIKDSGVHLSDTTSLVSSMWSANKTKDYISSNTSSVLHNKGGFDASVDMYPSGGSIYKGDVYHVTVPGTIGQLDLVVGDVLIALLDSPGQLDINWAHIQGLLPYQGEDVSNKEVAVLDTSIAKYPVVSLINNYFTGILDTKQLLIPATSDMYIRGDGTLGELTPSNVGLDKVSNTPYLTMTVSSFVDDFDALITTSPNDILIIEDSGDAYKKKHVLVNSLPKSTAAVTNFGGKVPSTRMINEHVLDTDIFLTLEDIGLSEVNNTADSNKPISNIMTNAITNKVETVNVAPVTKGSATHTITMTVNDQGQITEIAEVPIQLETGQLGLGNVKNIDTTTQANVYLTEITGTASGDVLVDDSGQVAFEKIQTQVKNLINKLNAGAAGSIIRISPTGALVMSNITFSDTDGGTATVPSSMYINDLLSINTNLLVHLVSDYDPANSMYPAVGIDGSPIKKANVWIISKTGVIGTHNVQAGDLLFALIDQPGQTGTNWNIIQTSLQYIPEDTMNKDTVLSNSATKYPSNKAVKTYIDTTLTAYQDTLPKDNDALSYLAGDLTLQPHKASSILLENVLNKPQLGFGAGSLFNLPLKSIPSVNDIVLVETLAGTKKYAMLGSFTYGGGDESTGSVDFSTKLSITRSVNGHTLDQNVIITKADIGLGNVNNTADIDKPISTSQQLAIDGLVPNTRKVNDKPLDANIIISKENIGVNLVQDVLDINKPISTALQTALNTKLAYTPTNTAGQLLVSTTGNGVVTDGYTLNDEGSSAHDIWSLAKVTSHFQSTVSSLALFSGVTDSNYPTGTVSAGNMFIATSGPKENTAFLALVDSPTVSDWADLQGYTTIIPENTEHKVTDISNITTEDHTYPTTGAVIDYMQTQKGTKLLKEGVSTAGNLVVATSSGGIRDSGVSVVNSLTSSSAATVVTTDVIQAVLDTKQNTITGAVNSVVVNDLPNNVVVVTNSTGKLTTTTTTVSELTNLDDVNTNIQAALDTKQTSFNPVATELDMLSSESQQSDVVVVENDENNMIQLTGTQSDDRTNWTVLNIHENPILAMSVPPIDYSTYDLTKLQSYLKNLSGPFTETSTRDVLYPDVTIPIQAYGGSCFMTSLNRVYMAPYKQYSETNYHYFDCNLKALVSYTPSTAITYEQNTIIYSPLSNKGYFIPRIPGSIWYYVDGKNGNIETFTGISDTVIVFYGGVFVPTLNRIYLAPYNVVGGLWYYIDCNTDTVVTYPGPTTNSNAYSAAVYSPVEQRVYYAPDGQSTSSTRHYVNVNNNSVSIYSTTNTVHYSGCAFSPIQNRIYFSPRLNTSATQYYYIDCSTGTPVTYTVTPSNDDCIGATYIPTVNRIYFLMTGTDNHKQIYIDCNNGELVKNAVGTETARYSSSVYCPTIDVLFYTPLNNGGSAFRYLDFGTGTRVSKAFISK